MRIFSKTPNPSPNKGRLMRGLFLLSGMALLLGSCKKTKVSTAPDQEITITLPPPPPPPPPPPKVEPPPPVEKPPEPEEMVEQEVVPDDEPPPDDSPIDTPPSDLGSNATGSGPSIGAGTGGSGRIGGTGRKGGGSKWGYYAAKVQTTVKDALGRNGSTQKASFSMQVRIWADSTGRITKAILVGSSGSPAVDQAIKNQVLVGLQLSEPPPAGMPMPITMRISASKPR